MRNTQTSSFSYWALVLLLGVSCQTRIKIPPPVLTKTQEIPKADATRMKQDILLLSSASFEGRGPSSLGLTKASEFIAKEYAAAHLLSIGDDGYWGNYEVPMVEQKPGVIGKAIAGDKVTFTDISRMISFGGVPAADVEGDVVYDTFELELELHQALQGKIALMPEWSEDRFSVDDLKTRVNRAIQAGAIAVLTIPDKLYPPPLDPPSIGTLSVPVARIHPNIANRWLKAVTLKDSLSPLGVRLSLHFEGRSLIAARNVFGGLPGKGNDAKAIVISAHYDHVGMGRPNWDGELDILHPGADDNASGTAALLETARILGALPSCGRPIFFVAYSYEEEGLLGSEAFVDKMKDKIELVINLDMVGRRNDNAIEIDGRPSKEMRMALDKTLPGRWFYGKLPSAQEGPQSDHTTFLLRNIPAMTLTTGLHEDHHQPTDTPDKIDFVGAAQIVDVAVSIVRELSCR
jgi:hypothetical protein